MTDTRTRRQFMQQSALAAGGMALGGARAHARDSRPNVVWICVEDMSAHMSCYGETTIRTPAIDRLADEGTRFQHAFVTCPVCSPSRTALITGMYQTTMGGHQHRSSRHESVIRLPESIRPVPLLFRDAGYFVTNGQMIADEPRRTKNGKTDYNFEYRFHDLYDAADWRLREPGQPFFAQVQLRGGKKRSAKVDNPVDPDDVTLPPYYPDHPELRKDWAAYLNSVKQVDAEVARILETLHADGDLANTVVFFWTDHGISHVRDKQYLYEGGIHVPLIVRGPGISQGEVNGALVEHIDIAWTSLHLCGIDTPGHLQGQSLLNGPYRTSVVSARDRCDETVERMRCVRTHPYKYIRNGMPERSHTRSNRYKDGKAIMKTMRALYADGQLSPEQGRVFLPTRPREELYDLENDPHELVNLAGMDEHQDTLHAMRHTLSGWMRSSGDLGLFPEPAVMEMQREVGSPCEILKNPVHRNAWETLMTLEEAALRSAAHRWLPTCRGDSHPAVRAAACYEMGRSGLSEQGISTLGDMGESDGSDVVRVAAWQVLARCRAGNRRRVREGLVRLLQTSPNEGVRHYAALGLEDLREDVRPVLDMVRAATSDPYDSVKRVTSRIVMTYDPAAAESG